MSLFFKSRRLNNKEKYQMSLFTVDAEKCNRDGICAAECPIKIIALENKEAVPEPVTGAEDFCINCGHCVAVCPTGALSHRNMTPEQCPSINPEWILSPEQAEQFLRSRRSIRNYKKKVVDKDTLGKLIDIARFAPSGHNTQTVSWHVVYDTDELKRLIGFVVDWMRYMIKDQPQMAQMLHLDMVVGAWEAGVDTVCREAPHVIVAHGHKADRMAATSCTIAMTYLELAAPSLGLGACWAGFFNVAAMTWPPMQEALSLPEGHTSQGAMMVGYPKFKYHRLPLRNPARITWR
jgi:nitroreductase/NAD-dependent dihydropyrimidine dehydrogenase PreA subunit